MEKCPKCSKIAVDNDQCLACGIVVSKWLKLHSISVPGDLNSPTDKNIEKHTSKSESPGKTPGASSVPNNLKPPEFIFDKDATIPFSAMDEPHPLTGQSKDPTEQQTLPMNDNKIQTPPSSQGPSIKAEFIQEKPHPSFLGETEEEIINLRKDLKTDWEEHYQKSKGRFGFGDKDKGFENVFKIRNVIISVSTIVLALLLINVKFFLRFGIGTEYSVLQPLVTTVSLISILIGLGTFFTLNFSSVSIKNPDSKKPKVTWHPIQLVEILLIIFMTFLAPIAPRFEVDARSTFPIIPEKEITEEFLAIKGIANFYRPVLGPDNKSIYAIHLFGQTSGFIVKLLADGDYETIVEGPRIIKFRFLDKNRIIYLTANGLFTLTIPNEKNQDFNPSQDSINLLEDYKPSDFDISRDGRKIVLVWGGDLWISLYPFETAVKITDTPNNLEMMPSFYSTGDRILFVRDMIPIDESKILNMTIPSDVDVDTEEGLSKNPEEEEPVRHNQVFLYNITEKKELRITDDGYNYYYPLMSDDLEKIAVTVEITDNPTIKVKDITFYEKAVVLMNPDASSKVRLFPPLIMQLQAMHEMYWYPDGKKILIGIHAMLQTGVYKISF
ncbi:MAG: hypothetical protein JW737_05505 [Acidobacteria bacterium]|nr:hypothetical protein [Acidobacteriota bacterium]